MTTGYHLALFLHIAALLAAISASTLVHFAERRVSRVDRVADAQWWQRLLLRVTMVFPLALLTLLATGSYMVGSLWAWRLGWVQAGVTAVLLLFVNGIRLGKSGRTLLRALDQAAAGGVDRVTPELRPSRAVGAGAWANTCLAVSVVFVMSMKLAIVGSFTALAVGVATGLAIGLWPEGTPALSDARTASEAT